MTKQEWKSRIWDVPPGNVMADCLPYVMKFLDEDYPGLMVKMTCKRFSNVLCDKYEYTCLSNIFDLHIPNCIEWAVKEGGCPPTMYREGAVQFAMEADRNNTPLFGLGTSRLDNLVEPYILSWCLAKQDDYFKIHLNSTHLVFAIQCLDYKLMKYLR
jgi:hypothetical protein